MNRDRFAETMMMLGFAFREETPIPMLEVYYAALSDLDEDDVIAAMHESIKLHAFFPKVAEIREIARRIRSERRRREQHEARQRETQELIAQGRLRPIMPVALPDPDAPRSNTGPRSFKEIMRAAAAKRKAAEVSSQDDEEGTSSGES